jgi:hypothetical protein
MTRRDRFDSLPHGKPVLALTYLYAWRPLKPVKEAARLPALARRPRRPRLRSLRTPLLAAAAGLSTEPRAHPPAPAPTAAPL